MDYEKTKGAIVCFMEGAKLLKCSLALILKLKGAVRLEHQLEVDTGLDLSRNDAHAEAAEDLLQVAGLVSDGGSDLAVGIDLGVEDQSAVVLHQRVAGSHGIFEAVFTVLVHLVDPTAKLPIKRILEAILSQFLSSLAD